MNKNNFAILMAGGVGSRFWPVSTTDRPKQFRDLLGSGETLIQTTFKRLRRLIPAENILILTNERYEELVHEQLPEVSREQVVLEPVMRNTAPAVLLAALKIRKKNENAVMLMAPSDHWIENEDAFVSDMEAAFSACRQEEKIITLGIRPTFPNTGFGYINFEKSSKKVQKVHDFCEKPSFQRAQEFIAKGNYWWNAGIFIWNASCIVRSFQRNLPEMYDLFSPGIGSLNSSKESEFIATAYPRAEDISVDYGILEKEKNVYLVCATFDWNDLGTWGSVYNEVDKDQDNNAVLNARVHAEGSSGNIISSSSNRVLVLDGLNDYIIIDEKEILLIVPKEQEQEIKTIRSLIMKKFGGDLG